MVNAHVTVVFREGKAGSVSNYPMIFGAETKEDTFALLMLFIQGIQQRYGWELLGFFDLYYREV